MEKNWKNELGGMLPQEIRTLLTSLGEEESAKLEEIRLRLSHPIEIVGADFSRLLPDFLLDERLSGVLLERLCAHAVFAREQDIREGFLVFSGGYRVGLCGHYPQGAPARVTGFNIRIAREQKGCAEAIIRALSKGDGRMRSTLLLSAPGVGKTTMLRDMVRACSAGLWGLRPHRVCLVDERGEIGGCGALDLGPRTDMMEACARPAAIAQLLRSMSPEIIATDEIGGEADAEALRNAVLAGVSVLATAHADSLAEARRRRTLCPLMEADLFDDYVLLNRQGGTLRFRIEGGLHATDHIASPVYALYRTGLPGGQPPTATPSASSLAAADLS